MCPGSHVLPVQSLESSHMHCGLTLILSHNCLKEDRGKDSRFVDSCCSWGSRRREGSVSVLPMTGCFQRNTDHSLGASYASRSLGLAATYARPFKEVCAEAEEFFCFTHMHQKRIPPPGLL